MREICFAVTETDINNYAAISGDYNPIHLDKEEAIKQGFTDKVSHGMLTMAKIWSIISNHMLAPTDLTSEYQLEFLNPVHAGHTVVLQIEQNNNRLNIIGLCKETIVVKGYILIEKENILPHHPLPK